jgi:hypothetical protein
MIIVFLDTIFCHLIEQRAKKVATPSNVEKSASVCLLMFQATLSWAEM